MALKFRPRKGRKTFKKRRVGRRSFKKARKSFKGRSRRPNARNFARTIETIPFEDIGTNSGNPYEFNFNISYFTRAVALQEQFRYYRARKVTWTYEALYNCYNASVGVATSTQPGQTVPQLYVKMDRLYQQPFTSLAAFQDAGAKPIALSRKFVMKYVPNIRWMKITPSDPSLAPSEGGPLISASGSAPAPMQLNAFTISKAPWINTENSGTTDTGVIPSAATPGTIGANYTNWLGHQGIVDIAVQPGTTLATPIRVLCTVEWEFKDPYVFEADTGSAVKRAVPKASVK